MKFSRPARIALGAIACCLCACGSDDPNPEFGNQNFGSDSFTDGGDADSFFDESSDASAGDDDGSASDAGAAQDAEVAIDGGASCQPDPAEPDNSAATATSLGAFSDSKRTTQELTIHTFHQAADEDWFLLEIEDSFDFSNPEPEIEVVGVGAEDHIEIAAWFTCDEGSGVECRDDATSDTTFGPGCVATGKGEAGAFLKLKTTCKGTNEDGTLLVRIRALEHGGTCEPYVARFRVD